MENTQKNTANNNPDTTVTPGVKVPEKVMGLTLSDEQKKQLASGDTVRLSSIVKKGDKFLDADVKIKGGELYVSPCYEQLVVSRKAKRVHLTPQEQSQLKQQGKLHVKRDDKDYVLFYKKFTNRVVGGELDHFNIPSQIKGGELSREQRLKLAMGEEVKNFKAKDGAYDLSMDLQYKGGKVKVVGINEKMSNIEKRDIAALRNHKNMNFKELESMVKNGYSPSPTLVKTIAFGKGSMDHKVKSLESMGVENPRGTIINLLKQRDNERKNKIKSARREISSLRDKMIGSLRFG